MKAKNLMIGAAAVGVIALLFAFAFPSAEGALTGEATVYKEASCGCCGGYVSFLQREGVDVDAQTVSTIDPIKNEYGVPAQMRSCHTTIIDGYVIEGHVPGAAIAKLLEERPDIRGIALPGMPSGVPGMPGPHEHVTVYAIDHDGSASEFMSL